MNWRAAAYMVQGVNHALGRTAMVREGYSSVGLLSASFVAIAWTGISGILLFAAALIAQSSRRAHFRLTVRGLTIATSAVAVWQLGATFLVYWVETRDMPSSGSFVTSLGAGLVGFTLLGAGARQFARARRHMVRAADEVLRRDPRPGILYLRPFLLDDKLAPGTDLNPASTFNPVTDHIVLPGFWFNRRSLSFEELLCKGMARVGPVVAIGRPGDELPRLGALRKYVGDSQWRSEVLKLMAGTRFTCLVLGESTGLLWELEQVLARNNPATVVLILPQDEAHVFDWTSFTRQAVAYGRLKRLPREIPRDTLALLFEHDWLPIAMTGRPTGGNYRQLAREMSRGSSTDA